MLAAWSPSALLGVVVLAAAAARDGRSAHARLVRWDAQWYAGIARVRLRPHRAAPGRPAPVGLRVLPAAARCWSGSSPRSTGLAYVDAGLVVSWVATAAGGLGHLRRRRARVHGVRVGVVLAVLWAALPIGIVTSMAYSEALFTALAAWALHAMPAPALAARRGCSPRSRA